MQGFPSNSTPSPNPHGHRQTCSTVQAIHQHHYKGDDLCGSGPPGRSRGPEPEAGNEQNVEGNIAERDQKTCHRHKADLVFNAQSVEMDGDQEHNRRCQQRNSQELMSHGGEFRVHCYGGDHGITESQQRQAWDESHQNGQPVCAGGIWARPSG